MIRKYQPDDTDRLVAVWRSAIDLAHPFLTDAFVAFEAQNMRNIYLPNAETWVIEDDGTAVGFIALIEDEIGGLFLHPSFHSKGFGKSMVDHARSLKGALRVEVFEQNAVGRPFYDRYGFVETGRYLHQESDQMMIKMRVSAS